MAPGQRSAMTEHDISMVRDVSALQADMRTVKHDVSNISGKIDALGVQIAKLNVKQERGLGFFAGVSFMIGSVGALLLALGKLLFGAHL